MKFADSLAVFFFISIRRRRMPLGKKMTMKFNYTKLIGTSLLHAERATYIALCAT
jgi:hypothetical protein